MRDESQACAGNRSRDVRRLASDEPVTRWCEDDGRCGDLRKRGQQIDFAELAEASIKCLFSILSRSPETGSPRFSLPAGMARKAAT